MEISVHELKTILNRVVTRRKYSILLLQVLDLQYLMSISDGCFLLF